jgi:acyl-CoA reductase-like NAD-dependent aldehyde dehydrogenase
MQTISPVDGSVYAEYDLASAADIDAALDRAVRGQRRWRTVPIGDRAAACRRAVELMVARADRLGTELTWQMGRPVAQSPFEIRRGFEERARYMIDIAEASLADLVLDSKDGFRRFIRHEPQGVVLVLAPWNYPYLASVNAVIPAIMAGNSVILKVSQQTPLVAERYAEAFAEAGLGDDVFQYLQAGHGEVAGMIEDGRVDFVSFTGSVDGGGDSSPPISSSAERIRHTCDLMRRWSRRSRTSWMARSSTPGSHAVRSSGFMSTATCIARSSRASSR